MRAQQRERIKQRFGDRASFRRVERKIYSHDVGSVPRLVRPLVGKRLADVVVQPETEGELIELAKWATAEGVALTPRGRSTSGYGGAVPTRGGVVVDFYRMQQVLDVDETNETVTVQPGIVWKTLDEILMKRNLTIRLYPTSYPSSTVGGWLAQGGAGIGSFEFGVFSDNVTRARIVLPGGEVRELTGDDLDLVADAEGITGFITEVTLKIQPADELSLAAVSFHNAENAQAFLEHVIERELPLWSVMLADPTMVNLKNKTPLREHLGHPVEERVELPDGFIASLAWRRRNDAAVADELDELIELSSGTRLSDLIAEHEWEHRTEIMRVKRLGPSLIPTEFFVPLENLAFALREVARVVKLPLAIEAAVLGGDEPEVAVLGFIPHDERTLKYNVAFALALSAIKAAERYGGRTYSTGMFFPHKTETVLGPQRTRRLRAYKRQVDPARIMNPGKVIDRPVALARILRAAMPFEPLIRRFANRLESEIGERIPTEDKRGIPADLTWFAYACSQCGYCIDDCDQFYGRGWESQSPRGKWFFLREVLEGREEIDQFMTDSFLSCTTCELCNARCCLALPNEPSWMQMRGRLIQDEKRMTFPPFEIMTSALEAEGDIWAGYRKNRFDWFPEDLEEKHGAGKQAQAVYFAGCTASYVENDIGIGTVRLLDEAGVDFTVLGEKENCCATPMLVAGKWDTFADTMKKNIEAVKAAGADTVITSCPACDMMWRHGYKDWAERLGIDYDIKTRHYSEIVSEKIASGDFTFPEPEPGTEPVCVTWHDSCHIGRVSGVYEPPREVIEAIPGVSLVEMASNRENGKCCGSVLTLIKEPDVAAEIGKERIDEAVEVGAQKLLALCPCCEFQLRVSADKKDLDVEIVDLSRFAAERLGYELPDPHPEVKAQWAVFEKMIALMTPEGFAELMGTMWPEILDAMPLGMGRLMRLAGRLGIVGAMKPLFPVLFPRLLPLMMPKLLPTMLERIGERVPMPDYMAEQMPDMMPGVMDNLMPHMIGDVVPLVTQPLIDHLQHRPHTPARAA